MCHSVHVEIRGYLVRVSSLLHQWVLDVELRLPRLSKKVLLTAEPPPQLLFLLLVTKWFFCFFFFSFSGN